MFNSTRRVWAKEFRYIESSSMVSWSKSLPHEYVNWTGVPAFLNSSTGVTGPTVHTAKHTIAQEMSAVILSTPNLVVPAAIRVSASAASSRPPTLCQYHILAGKSTRNRHMLNASVMRSWSRGSKKPLQPSWCSLIWRWRRYTERLPGSLTAPLSSCRHRQAVLMRSVLHSGKRMKVRTLRLGLNMISSLRFLLIFIPSGVGFFNCFPASDYQKARLRIFIFNSTGLPAVYRSWQQF